MSQDQAGELAAASASSASEVGRRSFEEGHAFETQVADLYRLLGYSVEQRRGFEGREVDLLISQRIGDLDIIRAIECKRGSVTADQLDAFITRLRLVRGKYPTALGTIVSASQFTSGVREHAAAEGIKLTEFKDLQAALIDGHAYCRLLVQEASKNEVYRLDRFVEPRITVDQNSIPEGASQLLNRWLGDPTWNQLTLLGDVGSGKSFLTRHLAFRLAKEYLERPIENRLPIRIDLRETDRLVSLEGLVLTHLSRHGLGNTRFEVFLHALAAGRIVLILDGFDEMAARINPRTTVRNFYELSRCVSGEAKVLLTCRTHYFKSRIHEEQVILGESTSSISTEARELYWDLISRKGYRIAYLQPFGEQEVESFVAATCGPRAPVALSKIKATYNLVELSQRPLLLDMIVRSLESLRDREINAATLYGVYTDAWIHRDSWRDLLSSRSKLEFLLSLAKALWQDDVRYIHHSQLARYVESYFARQLEDGYLLAELDAEVRTATFLIRDSGGEYGFAHKSYLEYFVAKGVAEGFAAGQIHGALKGRRFSPEILAFLADLVGPVALDVELESILTGPYQAEISENALLVLYSIRRTRTPAEQPIELPPHMQLGGARLHQVHLPRAQMKGVDLREAALIESVLVDADLTGCQLSGTQLQQVNGRRCDFSGGDVIGSRFDAADLEGTEWSNCSIASSRFTAASLIGARFTGAVVSDCTFDNAVVESVVDLSVVPPAPAFEADEGGPVLRRALLLCAEYAIRYRIDQDDLSFGVVAALYRGGREPESASLTDLVKLVRTVGREQRLRSREREATLKAVSKLAENYEPADSTDLDAQLINRDQVAHFLSLLSEEARNLLVLRFIEGHSEAEIAKMTGLERYTISRRINAAVRVLRSRAHAY